MPVIKYADLLGKCTEYPALHQWIQRWLGRCPAISTGAAPAKAEVQFTVWNDACNGPFFTRIRRDLATKYATADAAAAALLQAYDLLVADPYASMCTTSWFPSRFIPPRFPGDTLGITCDVLRAFVIPAAANVVKDVLVTGMDDLFGIPLLRYALVADLLLWRLEEARSHSRSACVRWRSMPSFEIFFMCPRLLRS